MKKKTAIMVLLICATAMVSYTTSAFAEKIKIEKLDDLPRHTYRIDIKAVELFENPDALMKLVSEVKQDLEADLEKYEIADKATLKDYYSKLGTIAIIEKRYDDFRKYLDLRRKIEEKEGLRLTSGLISLAYIKTIESGEAERSIVFRKNLSELVKDLPFEIVESQIKSSKGRAEILSRNLIEGVIESRIQPALDDGNGEMSKDVAQSLISYSRTVFTYLPFKELVAEVLSEYLDANKVEKPNIWTEREVDLTESKDGTPVTIAVWDSGVDEDIFGERMWVNENEIAGNNIDDDNNGFTDDFHGIAYTLHSDKTTNMLFPIGDIEADRPRLQRQMKGLTDISSGVDSEEATELKKILSSLEKDKVKPFIEDVGKYGNYAHGTHVAGISVRGNPYARILISRITFGFTMIPEEPTIEQARIDSMAFDEVIKYYKDNGVRVVNMSFGGNLAGIESALEANNAGGTAEERKALARQIFEIGKIGFFEAIKNVPEILFVTSAGNSDNDVVFEEFIPSTFDLPNIISVGAVDQAGDETGFTSFGKVDVYSNGYEVLSYVPGGDQLKMSGTSMSSPNVTNLAGKLFALHPELTAVQVRELIVKGCSEKEVGERTVRLINPRKSMELLQSMN